LYKKIQDLKQTGSIFNKQEAFKPASSQSTAFQQKCMNEDVREAQSLSFPVTLIIIFAIFMLTIAMKDPTSPIAVWASIIPFTSPIVMIARVAYGLPGTVPYWQLFLSMGLLIGSFILMVWFSGKIYRTGILMYGKKPTWKEMIKWALRK